MLAISLVPLKPTYGQSQTHCNSVGLMLISVSVAYHREAGLPLFEVFYLRKGERGL